MSLNFSYTVNINVSRMGMWANWKLLCIPPFNKYLPLTKKNKESLSGNLILFLIIYEKWNAVKSFGTKYLNMINLVWLLCLIEVWQLWILGFLTYNGDSVWISLFYCVDFTLPLFWKENLNKEIFTKIRMLSFIVHV